MSDTFLTDILKERLKANEWPLQKKPENTLAHALVNHVLIAAERGNVAAMSLIWDRVEGPADSVLDLEYLESVAAPLVLPNVMEDSES
jgi:hypothetical protein